MKGRGHKAEGKWQMEKVKGTKDKGQCPNHYHRPPRRPLSRRYSQNAHRYQDRHYCIVF